MIDPRDVTKYTRTQAELEEFWLFCLVVAGKTAMTQAKLLEAFLVVNRDNADDTPFQTIKKLISDDYLLEALKLSRLGQFTRLEKAMKESLTLDLANDPVDTFEAISGVGSKTARFFLLHTRENQNIAVLDTHVLRWMRDQGLTTQKGTPPKGPKYAALETIFIAEAKKAGKSIAEMDLEIWRKYSGNEISA